MRAGIVMSLMAFVHASNSEATCTVGEQCSSDETGMLQKNAQVAHVKEFSKANQTDGGEWGDLCRCKEPNGNNNAIECVYHVNGMRAGTFKTEWKVNGNCPLCCQCTSATNFPRGDRADFCHGGDECGTCS